MRHPQSDAIAERLIAQTNFESRLPPLTVDDAWLDCSVEDAPSFMKQYPAELLQAEPKPLAPRSRAKPPPLPKVDDFDAEPPLF